MDGPINSKTSDEPTSNVVTENSPPRVIAIGASAGGLEALEQFFLHVPVNSGAAYVVIQHLDPNHSCILPELLQRATPMPVSVAEHGLPVEPDRVYVIPPNRDLSILHSSLYLTNLMETRGLHLPIDRFFCALAEDQLARATGVILSGMGFDGTLGASAIKQNSGLVAVQTPETAKYDSMPRSVINAGYADIILPPEAIAESIFARFKDHSQPPAVVHKPQASDTQTDLESIILLLRKHTGNDFSAYKKNTIYRRIERRMGLHHIQTKSQYVQYLQENPQELSLLFKELLIGVTQFFRDPSVWECFKAEALPNLFQNYPAGKNLRAWIPACSTGEEAYTLAMLFKEALFAQKLHGQFSLQIFATDLDADAINKARQGRYPISIANDFSRERLQRFFIAEHEGYTICKEIREMVIFAEQNIIMDPPFMKLDILSCRNLLIYLGQELQQKLIPLFYYALTPHGLLILGNAESISNYTSLFALIDNKARIYRRLEHSLSILNIEFPTKSFPVASMVEQKIVTTKPQINLQNLVEQLLLQKFTPSAVVVTAEGDILYINGRTGKYLEPAAGKANWNIHAMAREGLRHILARALQTAQHQTEMVKITDIRIPVHGSYQTINLLVQAITQVEALQGLYIVVFIDVEDSVIPVNATKKSNSTVKALQTELRHAQDELQLLHAERQSSQEELKSANEELQSTNEELQSTNEELTTSKEEMQSMNEELQTMNAELQSKVNDLSWVNNDMKNLLDSMEIATIFLDGKLNIRRFTSHATQLYKLIASDIGRPLSDIASILDYPNLHQDAQSVFQTLIFSEKEVKSIDNAWFKARIMPYRTQDNVIDGVVITFIDITATKILEQQLIALSPVSSQP